jgi:hypothetical protein
MAAQPFVESTRPRDSAFDKSALKVSIRLRNKKSIRYCSSRSLWGYPLVAIAVGPDHNADESRGIARGIIAIGDIAVGVVAVGGMAAGVFSLGGLSCGLITVGGVAVGGLVLGGVALGGVAFGGVAVGLAAGGGVAIGYLAAGGKAVGTYVMDANRRDPQAVDFFRSLLPWIAPKS